jgi:hypothetical protein
MTIQETNLRLAKAVMEADSLRDQGPSGTAARAWAARLYAEATDPDVIGQPDWIETTIDAAKILVRDDEGSELVATLVDNDRANMVTLFQDAEGKYHAEMATREPSGRWGAPTYVTQEG